MSRTSSPNFSPTTLTTEQPGSSEGSTPRPDPPLRYLQAVPQYGVILCTEHQWAYTPNDHLLEHLKRAHGVEHRTRQRVKDWIRDHNVATSVSNPQHYGSPISGLRDGPGWLCNVGACMQVGPSLPRMLEHCRLQHDLHSKAQVRARGTLSPVRLQTWFAKAKEYFIVNPTLASTTSTNINVQKPDISTPTSSSSYPLDFERSQSTLCSFQSRFSQAQHAAKAKHQRVPQAVHTAELSPWQRLTRFSEHLVDIEIELIPSAYAAPRQEQDHPFLWIAAQSVSRVLTTAHSKIESLHHVEAKRLNSFQVGTVSQDPFTWLQSTHSLNTYISTFVRLVCYFHRVQYEDHYQRVMFKESPAQHEAYERLSAAIETYLEEELSDNEGGPNHTDRDAADGRLLSAVDQYMLAFCITLVEHLTPKGDFSSPIVSFCAAICRAGSGGGWLPEGRCSGILSQLIYCCQLIILADAHIQLDQGDCDDVDTALKQLGPQWLLNDSKSPVSDLSRFRLYAMHVSMNSVAEAPIRWNRDGTTLHYQDITYEVRFLGMEMDFCLQQARLIFERDLCLGLPDIPTFNIADLSDNWDARAPGWSFLDDPRNASVIGEYRDWLQRGIANSPQLYSQVFHHNSNHPADDVVRSDFARQFESSCQLFLSYAASGAYRGSGQCPRVEEFRTLMWQNTDLALRNLFAHDGHLLYVLRYHKSLHRTHASRFPVRVLLPGFTEVLLQFLVLVTPMREFFCQEAQCPAETSTYLWHDGHRVWDGAHIRRVSERTSGQATGVAIGPRSWRQIAVGIAIKKFSGLHYQGDLDLPGDPEDDMGGQSILESWGGAMADVFHHQAAHSVATGNRAYGGTINFGHGLTDAALQEYIRASRLWHQLCQGSDPASTRSQALNHRRQASTAAPWSADVPLLKRVAIQQQPRRHQRIWGSETVQTALQRLYPEQQPARFKTQQQKAAIECIAGGRAEVIAVLATGEGKSLSFMLPSCLPHAATTVVVVPLIALQSDLVRRCQEAGLVFSVWDRQSSTDSRRHLGSPLIFVAVEQAVRPPFLRFLGQLDASEALDRVVFDEAHLALTSMKFRPKMRLLKLLRQFWCQVVCLTATLPPLMQAQFERCLLLAQPSVIRSLTFRRDIVYKYHVSSRPGDFLTYICTRVRGVLDRLAVDPLARAIIYTQNRPDADSLTARLACVTYYSDSGDRTEKDQAIARWRSGESKVMVATSAFGLGVDYPHVRVVVHMGLPRNMIDFAQEVGRLGRDGRGGTSYVILPFGWRPEQHLSTELDQQLLTLPTLAMKTYVGHCRCLSAVLSRFQDGRDNMQYCNATDLMRRCTACEVQGVFRPQAETDFTRYWDAESADTHVHTSTAEKPALIGTMNDHEAIPEADTKDESEVDHSEDPCNDIEQGATRLQLHLRDAERGRAHYERRLEAFQGRCMICTMLGFTSSKGQWHTLAACPNPLKRQFFDAKRKAIERGKRQGGWIPRFVACTWCGNPQDICVVEPGEAQGRSHCHHPDVVFPTAWALFRQPNHWGCQLTEISGQTSSVCANEEHWVDWLGQECELYGMRSCEAARMADWVMTQLEREYTQ